MNIIFDKNINLFQNKTEIQIVELIPQYRKLYKPILSTFINELNFDERLIDSIHIIHDKPSYGTSFPIIRNGQLYFIIELSDDILVYISEVQNSLETYKSKSVFQHELSHCIEIKNLYDKNILNVPKLFDDNIHINTTYNYIYSEAVNIWSEFFACYHNYNFNEWHEIPNVDIDIEQLIKWINASKYHLTNHEDIQLCEDMFNFLHKFWYHLVSMIAIHLHNHEDLLINDYKTSKYPYIKEYFQYIYNFFKTYMNFYPTWISEERYIQLGKALMKILEVNGMTYSTDDLSDNFIFIKTKIITY